MASTPFVWISLHIDDIREIPLDEPWTKQDIDFFDENKQLFCQITNRRSNKRIAEPVGEDSDTRATKWQIRQEVRDYIQREYDIQ
ncbi:hypothetical protein OB920_13115 [Halobacteria archaeon HArc-gm2]|nr:hypothetical protein [Halobacteria archaeon HArc-gm2]